MVDGRGDLPGLSTKLRRHQRRRDRRPGRGDGAPRPPRRHPGLAGRGRGMALADLPLPLADFGYDISDFTDVAAEYGTLADLDRLVEACHARGLRLMLDLVPCHTSIQHPWFIESRSSRASPRRNWYTWADPKPDGGPPNNWRARIWRPGLGAGSGPRASTTCTPSTLSSRTSTGGTRRWPRRSATSCASGSTGASTVSGSTPSPTPSRTRCCATTLPPVRPSPVPTRPDGTATRSGATTSQA